MEGRPAVLFFKAQFASQTSCGLVELTFVVLQPKKKKSAPSKPAAKTKKADSSSNSKNNTNTGGVTRGFPF